MSFGIFRHSGGDREVGISLGRLEGCPLSERLNTAFVSDLCIIIDFRAIYFEKMLLFNIMPILYIQTYIFEYESYCSLYNRKRLSARVLGAVQNSATVTLPRNHLITVWLHTNKTTRIPSYKVYWFITICASIYTIYKVMTHRFTDSANYEGYFQWSFVHQTARNCRAAILWRHFKIRHHCINAHNSNRICNIARSMQSSVIRKTWNIDSY